MSSMGEKREFEEIKRRVEELIVKYGFIYKAYSTSKEGAEGVLRRYLCETRDKEAMRPVRAHDVFTSVPLLSIMSNIGAPFSRRALRVVTLISLLSDFVFLSSHISPCRYA